MGLGVLVWLASVRSMRRRAGLPVDSREVFFLKAFVAVQTLLLLVLLCNRYRGIPVALLILAGLALVVHGLIARTVFGRYLMAIGGNQEAAYACGVPVDRTVITAFAIMGGIVGLTGLMQTAYAGASTTTVGELMELDAIAACVIGGASLRGGRGSVLGTLLGALIMASLLNGMTLLALAPELKLMVRGTVLVVAVLLDLRFQQRGSDRAPG
jgi:D-xylose transport system permease protein